MSGATPGSSAYPPQRRRPSDSQSLSPVMSTQESRMEHSVSTSGSAHGRREVDRRTNTDWRTQPASPPPNGPTPSRMSLSVLVNSPPVVPGPLSPAAPPAHAHRDRDRSADRERERERDRYAYAPPQPSRHAQNQGYEFRSASFSPPPQSRRDPVARHRYERDREPEYERSRDRDLDRERERERDREYEYEYDREYDRRAHSNSHSHSQSPYAPPSQSRGPVVDYPPVAPPVPRSFYNHGPPQFPHGTHGHRERDRPSGSGSGSHAPIPPPPQPPAIPMHPRGHAPSHTFWERPAPPPARLEPGAPPPRHIAYRLGDILVGSEEVWEDALKAYQHKREAEVVMIEGFQPGLNVQPKPKADKKPTKRAPAKKPAAATPTTTIAPATAGGSTDDTPDPTSAPTEEKPILPQEPLPSPAPAPAPAAPPAKRKGWPADHPTRIAAREAKDAAILAAGGTLPKRRVPKKAKVAAKAALEDELLGLAGIEGDEAGAAGLRSSPVPGSEMEVDDAGPSEPVIITPETIVMPCGLTRAEVIRKVEHADLEGLTETDVKQVQDEMWIRAKETVGGVSIRKDGLFRRKPGPAKGWKAMRGEDGVIIAQKKKGKGKQGVNGGGSSVIGDGEDEEGTEGGAEDDIAQLLDEGEDAEGSARDSSVAGTGKKPAAKKPNGKRKRAKVGVEEEGSRVDTDDDRSVMLDPTNGDDGATSHVNGHDTMDNMDDFPSLTGAEDGLLVLARAAGPPPKKAKTKATPASLAKAKQTAWVKLSKGEKEMSKKAEMLAGGMAVSELAQADLSLSAPVAGFGVGEDGAVVGEDGEGVGGVGGVIRPNTVDRRGISETEARVRYGLVEELQRQAWGTVVKDVPRVYRLYQSVDQFTKTDRARVANACVRSAFTQRSLKPTYRSAARIQKESVAKGKRVIKELLTYWRKNEKDENLARKKAEKETLDRQKAEEELREAKRQSRKLNFLLTQTELYSHFIGKKIKTAEAERPDDEDLTDAQRAEVAGGSGGKGGKDGRDDLEGDAGEALPDIDYDDDDEENLRKHAARGAQAAIVAARDRARAFDDAKPSAKKDEAMPIDLDGDELNFQNPSLGADSVTITQPKMLMAQLKEYQLKGLTWLGNLYEQGINGILADEMGLGKTIQSISLLAYLAEHHNLWGPFLVIAPASTLHNWQQELARFVPKLKALPYWGAPKDRETLRRIWSKKNMTFDKDSPFHILITSYQLAVMDEKYLSGVKWQYMILDEAQAIKSSTSARWKSLLSLPCRNRLLLTGTPIQNSMHELWALLHFIMPSLFDSHEEFSEWFSKDVENAAAGESGSLQPEQLRRLHMILKPFMLRRVKKHVQKELGDKIEIDVLVDLSQRQRAIYKALRQRVSVSDLIAQASSTFDGNSTKNLMNLVMQFRKVCNHPDLFERADVVSPFMFGSFSHSNISREGDGMYLPDSAKNAITVELPRLLWDESVSRVDEDSMAGGEGWALKNLCSIWNPAWIRDRLEEDDDAWGFLRIKGMGKGEVCMRAKGHPLVTLLDEAGEKARGVERGVYESDSEFAASTSKLSSLPPRVSSNLAHTDTPLRDISSIAWNTSILSRPDSRFSLEKAVAPPLRPIISSRSYINTQSRLSSDPLVTSAMYGAAPSELDDPNSISHLHSLTAPNLPPRGLFSSSPANQGIAPSMLIPPTKRLIVDSAKLARLDSLLRELKAGGHRVLLYFQMTRMMDLVEEYLIYRQYKYMRLDGGSAIGDRRDMVTNWQTNSDYFVFCLSTRAGGLGINLTAADTVIFYDHDWNPSNDAQAMDRAHRVGQTKQVTVYRLIARGTIEERILKLARAKKDVQDIVVGTKTLTDVAKPSEIVSLFMDDEELAESVAKRKQAEAHGYVAPVNMGNGKAKPIFGDGLGGDDEDDFFNAGRQVINGEDEDFGDEVGEGSGGAKATTAKPKVVKEGAGAKKKAAGTSHKRKAPTEAGDKKSAPKKKKVKVAVGPDGLPI